MICVESCAPSTLWYEVDDATLAHPYTAELEAVLASRNAAYRVERGHTMQDRDRQHQVEAVDRWFYKSWMRLDTKLRSLIVEGIVVVLAWFDADPTVFRTFGPPQRVYTNPVPRDPKPISPLLELFETGRVLGVNFPIGLNDALARMLAILMKLNMFDAMLRRIPIISANRGPTATRCSRPTSIARLRVWADPIRQGTNATSC